jgi:plasmid stability protein
MTNITVKNIPEETYIELKRVAKSNHRSINSEIIVCIERAVQATRINPEEILSRARQLREKVGPYFITDEEIKQAKSEGRP